MESSVKISIFPNRELSYSRIKKIVDSLYKEAKEQGIIIRFHDQVTELIGDYKTVINFFSNEILKLSKAEKISEISVKLQINF